MVEPELDAAAGLGRWIVGVVAVMPVCTCFPPEEQAALGNHSAQSPASVWVASSRHAMVGHVKSKCGP